MSTSVVLASECPADDPGFCAPTVLEFFPAPLVEFNVLGVEFAVTRITIISAIATLALGLLFVASVRRPSLVPGKLQWFGEAGYSFVRDGIAREVIGKEGLRFAPYLAALFFFILVNNLMGIIPFAQLAPTRRSRCRRSCPGSPSSCSTGWGSGRRGWSSTSRASPSRQASQRRCTCWSPRSRSPRR